MVSNVKVIVGEKCATQYRLVVGGFKVCTHAHPKRRFVPRTKVWKLKDFGNQVEFSNFFNALIQGNETGKTLDERSEYLKNNLINATKQVCGVSAKHTGKGRLGGGMTRRSKLCPTNANVSKYGKQEETEMLIRRLNVHPTLLYT